MAIIRLWGRRAGTFAFWAAPPLLSVVLYWPGLTAWFQQDDFAWLGLRDLVVSWSTFWWALFAPLAQGTIRTLSERAFFMSFSTVFGMHPLPYRCAAFLTFAASLTLLSAVCTKVTGSRAAGFCAAILWTVNSAVAIPLSWTSVYYEILCSFFFLLNFWLWIRYVETGERRFYIAQLVTFALGFGVLELNVVYPALAAAYALCRAPKFVYKTLPLFAISGAFMVLHFAVAPLPDSGPYKLHWDSTMLFTLWTYWQWAIGRSRLIAVTAFLSLGLVGFLVSKLHRRQWIALLFPAWFLIVLAPLLPLRDHISPEYLTIPVIGLAMLGGWGLVSGWQAGPAGKIAAVSLLSVYLYASVPVARAATQSFHDRSFEIRKLVVGVTDLRRDQPEKMILLRGVNWNMLWAGLFHRPFRLYGIREVYLVAEDEGNISDSRLLGSTGTFFIDPVLERKALEQDRALVYEVRGVRVMDVTTAFRKSLSAIPGGELAAKVEVGNDLTANQLGPTWYGSSGGWRWMPQHATVKLRGPRGSSAKLYVAGFCPAVALKSGPLGMRFSVDGEKFPHVSVLKPDVTFSFTFDLPAQLTGRPVVEVAVDLDRVFFVPPDTRGLGLPFISFEIR